MSETSSLSFSVNLQASADQVWQALVDPDLTEKYYFSTRVESDWRPGSPVVYRDPQGRSAVEGRIVEFTPSRRLVTTFEPKWVPEGQAGPPSTVVWEIESNGNISTLKLTHKDLDPAHPIVNDFRSGWPVTLDSLKAALEPGKR